MDGFTGYFRFDNNLLTFRNCMKVCLFFGDTKLIFSAININSLNPAAQLRKDEVVS